MMGQGNRVKHELAFHAAVGRPCVPAPSPPLGVERAGVRRGPRARRVRAAPPSSPWPLLPEAGRRGNGNSILSWVALHPIAVNDGVDAAYGRRGGAMVRLLRHAFDATRFYFVVGMFCGGSLAWSLIAGVLERFMRRGIGARLGQFVIMFGFRGGLWLMRLPRLPSSTSASGHAARGRTVGDRQQSSVAARCAHHDFAPA